MEHKRLNIFVSSTSRDLERYRDEVQKTILRMEHYPIGMEAFNPTQRNAVQLCYDQVQKADVFVGIYAHRYGYAPANEITYRAGDEERHCPGDKSITHLEYDWAVERNLPMLLFILAEEDDTGNPLEWPEQFIEGEPGQRRLEQFKSDVMTKHVVGFFTSPDDLSNKVATGLHAVLSELDHAQQLDTQSTQKKRRRQLSLIGAVATILILGVIGLFALNGGSDDDPSPTPRDNNSSAAENPVDDGSRLVLISEIVGETSSGNINIARRLEDDLQDRIRESGLENVNVRVHTPSIDDESDALDLLEQEKADALVWGWYDDFGVNIRVILPGTGNDPEIVQTGEIPFESGDAEDSNVAIVVRDILPENVSFISLFVIGSLYYSADEYQSGFTAMNAAMENLPDNATLENEALVHYFNARQLQHNESADYVTIACEYARALELDPEFADAYNNLGVLSGAIAPGDYDTREAIGECLNQHGIDVWFTEQVMFEKALEIRPEWSVPRYNILKANWENRYDIDLIKSELEAIIVEDETLPGPYIMLGVISVEDTDFERARDYFATASELMPDNAELHFNLGQAELLLENQAEARRHFETALDIDTETQEAHLALANLAVEDGDNELAIQHLDAIPSVDEAAGNFFGYEGGETYYAAELLRSMLISDEQAVEILENLQDKQSMFVGVWETYLLAQLYHRLEQPESAAATFATLEGYSFDFHAETVDDNLTAVRNRQTTQLAADELIRQCYSGDETTENEMATWGTEANPCLPVDIDARIDAVYEIFTELLKYRFYYSDQYVFLGAACPFIFTRGDTDQIWQPDTTILYSIVGAENEHRQPRRLTNFNGELWVRELEPETSYIDFVQIKVVTIDGQEHYLDSADPALMSADDTYLVMDMGDDYYLPFPEFDFITDVAEVWVIAEGYYVPYAH